MCNFKFQNKLLWIPAEEDNMNIRSTFICVECIGISCVFKYICFSLVKECWIIDTKLTFPIPPPRQQKSMEFSTTRRWAFRIHLIISWGFGAPKVGFFFVEPKANPWILDIFSAIYRGLKTPGAFISGSRDHLVESTVVNALGGIGRAPHWGTTSAEAISGAQP